MAGSVAKAYVQVIPSAEGIKNKLSNVFNSEMPSAGQSAGGIFGSNLVGKIKGLVAAAGIGKVLSDSLQSGAALQQSLGGVETLFKDSAATVISNAEKAYKTAGMSANQYMETVTGFSASLLQSLGGDTAAAAIYADRALVDMADNANKMGTSMESIQNAYQGFAKQNYTMLDNLKLGYGGTQSEMQRLIADAAKLTDVQDKLGVTVDANSMSFGNIVNAINVMQNQMGIAGATANEAATTFSGSLASMKAAFNDLMANLSTGRDIGPSLAALGETVFTFVQHNLLPMIGNVFKALPETLSSVLSMAIRGLNLAAANADAIVKMGVDLVAGIGSSIVTALPYLAEAAVNIAASIGDVIMSTDWAKVGNETINSLKDSFDIAAGEILGTDGNIVQSVLDAISTGLPKLLETGSVMVNKLVDGVFAGLPGLYDSAVGVITSFLNILLTNLPAVLSTGKSILLNVVEGIRQSYPQMLTSAAGAIGELLSGLVKNLPSIIAAGFDLIVSLITGIGNALPDIITAAGKITTNLWDAVKKINWTQLGKDIIQGLINGLGAMGNALWNAAKNVAASALDAIKGFFGIASPSKVMRDQVGKWIPSGVAVGIEANTKPLIDAMHDLSGLTSNTMQTDLQMTSALTRSGTISVNTTKPGTFESEDRIDQLVKLVADMNEYTVELNNANTKILREILSAILGIKIDGKTLYDAVKRESKRTGSNLSERRV